MATAIDVTRSRRLLDDFQPGTRRKPREFDVERAMLELADAESEKLTQMPTWRTCMDLMMPNRQGFDGQHPGQPRTPQEKFDSYPEVALLEGVGNIIGALCPPGSQWSEVTYGNAVPEARQEAIAKATEKITETVFEKLEQSLFETELHSAVHDLMVSTMFLAIDEGTRENPFIVKAGSLDDCFPVLGASGQVENVYRRCKYRPQDIKRQWRGARLSARIEKLIADKSRERVTLIEATTYEEGRGYRFTVFDPSDKSVIYDVPPDDPLAPSRWIVARMAVRPGETYGYGPAVVALPTVRTLNKTQELGLKARAKLLAPPTLFDTRSGLNPDTIRLGANYVGFFDGAAMQGGTPFLQIPPAGNNEWSIEDVRDYRRIIDRILYAEKVIPPVEDSHGMTAFEVQVRRQIMLQDRGVNVGRLQREIADAVIRRCVYILGKLGLIPPIKIDGRVFQVRPLGPIAQAQRADKATSTLAFVSQLRAAVGDQAAALAVKIEDVGAAVGKEWPGVDNSLLRDEQERAAMQEQAAQVAAAQAAGAGPTLDPTNLPGLE